MLSGRLLREHLVAGRSTWLIISHILLYRFRRLSCLWELARWHHGRPQDRVDDSLVLRLIILLDPSVHNVRRNIRLDIRQIHGRRINRRIELSRRHEALLRLARHL